MRVLGVKVKVAALFEKTAGFALFAKAQPIFQSVADEDEEGDRGGTNPNGTRHPKVGFDVVDFSGHERPLS